MYSPSLRVQVSRVHLHRDNLRCHHQHCCCCCCCCCSYWHSPQHPPRRCGEGAPRTGVLKRHMMVGERGFHIDWSMTDDFFLYDDDNDDDCQSAPSSPDPERIIQSTLLGCQHLSGCFLFIASLVKSVGRCMRGCVGVWVMGWLPPRPGKYTFVRVP